MIVKGLIYIDLVDANENVPDKAKIFEQAEACVIRQIREGFANAAAAGKLPTVFDIKIG